MSVIQDNCVQDPFEWESEMPIVVNGEYLFTLQGGDSGWGQLDHVYLVKSGNTHVYHIYEDLNYRRHVFYYNENKDKLTINQVRNSIINIEPKIFSTVEETIKALNWHKTEDEDELRKKLCPNQMLYCC